MIGEILQEINEKNTKNNMLNYSDPNLIIEQSSDDYEELNNMTTLNNISSMMSMDDYKHYFALK
jgi:hypothetical protein